MIFWLVRWLLIGSLIDPSVGSLTGPLVGCMIEYSLIYSSSNNMSVLLFSQFVDVDVVDNVYVADTSLLIATRVASISLAAIT